MQFHVPDPGYTQSAQSRASFRLAARIAVGFVALLWLVYLMNWAADLDPEPFGVRPREAAGLAGILLAPLAHGDFLHLVSNSAPLLVLGTAMLFLYPAAAPRVLPVLYLGPGLGVWLFGRSSVHLGASGLVYGLATYVFVAGLLRRDRRAIAASLIVAFLYGSLAWGVLPGEPRVSWETHLAAALLGLVLALALRRMDVPPRKQYGWDDEPPRADEAPEGGDAAAGPWAGPGADGRAGDSEGERTDAAARPPPGAGPDRQPG
jgi:membrane associated rhomboid family serine protease